MDLYTTNAAQFLHTQEAQRTTRELEYRRVAKERATAATSASEGPETLVPAKPRRSRGLLAFWLMRGHRTAAQ